MDYWENLNETSLPEKEDFYSQLNMEDITDIDYEHAKKFVKFLKKKYHDLHAQTHTLLLTDVFKIFRIICLKIDELHPAKFLSSRFKEGKNKIKSFN